MRVLVVDDHPVFLGALRSILESSFNDIEVTGEHSLEQAEKLTLEPFDLIIVDLSFRGKDITRDVCHWIGTNIEARFVVLTNFEDGRHMRLIAECGAQGYLPKSTPAEILTNVFRLILAGGQYFPQNLALGAGNGADGTGASPALPAQTEKSLTPRQTEVFELLAAGSTITEVAGNLGVSEPTVKSDISKATRALEARNRLQAVCKALDAGLIHPEFD